jgi:hypothetical protein
MTTRNFIFVLVSIFSLSLRANVKAQQFSQNYFDVRYFEANQSEPIREDIKQEVLTMLPDLAALDTANNSDFWSRHVSIIYPVLVLRYKIAVSRGEDNACQWLSCAYDRIRRPGFTGILRSQHTGQAHMYFNVSTDNTAGAYRRFVSQLEQSYIDINRDVATNCNPPPPPCDLDALRTDLRSFNTSIRNNEQIDPDLLDIPDKCIKKLALHERLKLLYARLNNFSLNGEEFDCTMLLSISNVELKHLSRLEASLNPTDKNKYLVYRNNDRIWGYMKNMFIGAESSAQILLESVLDEVQSCNRTKKTPEQAQVDSTVKLIEEAKAEIEGKGLDVDVNYNGHLLTFTARTADRFSGMNEGEYYTPKLAELYKFIVNKYLDTHFAYTQDVDIRNLGVNVTGFADGIDYPTCKFNEEILPLSPENISTIDGTTVTIWKGMNKSSDRECNETLAFLRAWVIGKIMSKSLSERNYTHDIDYDFNAVHDDSTASPHNRGFEIVFTVANPFAKIYSSMSIKEKHYFDTMIYHRLNRLK